MSGCVGGWAGGWAGGCVVAYVLYRYYSAYMCTGLCVGSAVSTYHKAGGARGGRGSHVTHTARYHEQLCLRAHCARNALLVLQRLAIVALGAREQPERVQRNLCQHTVSLDLDAASVNHTCCLLAINPLRWPIGCVVGTSTTRASVPLNCLMLSASMLLASVAMPVDFF